MRPTFLFLALVIGVGLGAPIHDSRIVNGSDALFAEFPFMVSLRSSSGSHTCGGTIISKEWILTAAHCITSKNPDDYSIQYGTNMISKNTGAIVKLKQVIPHQGYDDNNQFIHDIALIQVAEPLPFNELVHAVPLPDFKQYTMGGIMAQLVGWGLNATGGVIQNHLQKVDLQTVTDLECSKLHFDRIHVSNICAGVPQGGKGQCSGDSGGPLLVDGRQIGIVSWSVKPCTIAPYPGVFTEVVYYLDWIHEHTGIDIKRHE